MSAAPESHTEPHMHAAEATLSAVHVDAREVHRRFVEFEESGDAQQVVMFVIASMLVLSAMLVIAMYCCGLGASPHSDEPMFHGLFIPTVLDAIFGGNRRRRAMRPLAP